MSDPRPVAGAATKNKRSLRSVVPVVFAVVVTVVAFATLIDSRELVNAIASASVPLVGACVLVACFDLIVMAFKWRLLLRAFAIVVRPVVPIAAYFQSEVFGLFLPSTLGADGFRVWYLQRRGFRLRPAVSSVVVERTIGLLSSVVVACLLGPFAIGTLTGLSVTWLIPLGVGLWGLSWFAVPFLASRAGAAPRWRVWRLLPRCGALHAIRFLRSLSVIRNHVGTVTLYFALSQMEKTLYGLTIWLAAQSVHLVDVPLFAIVAATPVVAFLERIPISVRSIGIREGLYVALLSPFGITPTVALSVALVVRFVEVVRAAIGLVWWTAAGRVTPASIA